ncbi:DUF3080 domain-containing protein [Marinimicrobium sp. C6131]|uniref:DUF3080 family protein n=1 Tax=Marinimicrobium sp. C6131 TaxID=3022676 RepID=UPI00223CECA3|nr:DUF3080 family protein [Marinimicrobium sp. C6131]UZJ45529.1 DUF3080 domain-containing protein [Marinimicrobium sp. C6131]
MRVITCLLMIALLSACQPTPPAEAMLDDYLTRLSRVLSVEIPPTDGAPAPRMPPPRELQVELEPLSINLLDFWGFRQCGLAEVLGERNSILGRVMVPSQHLHMDGRILQQLRYCIQTLEDQELVALAEDLEQRKRQQWPTRYWNASAAAPELRAFWSPSTTPLTPGREASFQEALTALAFLAQLPERLNQQRWPERPDLESHYKALEQYALGGKLLQSLVLGTHHIHAANQMLQEAHQEETLCPAGLQKRELEYARNVMVKVFVGEVQPWLAAVNRRATSVIKHYETLLDQQPAEQRPTIQPFFDQVTERHFTFQNSLRDHVDLWKTLFEGCDSQAIPSR